MPDDRITDAKDLLKQVSDFGDRMRERRQFERKKLLWAATVEVRGQRFEGMIVDLSAGGARIKFDAPVTAGDELTLMLKQLDELGAKVVWQRKGEAGLKFLLAPDEVAARLQDKLAVDLGKASPVPPASPANGGAAVSSPPAAETAARDAGKRRRTLFAAAAITGVAALLGGSVVFAHTFGGETEPVALVASGAASSQQECSALMDKVSGATNQIDFSLHVASAVKAKCLDIQHLGPSDSDRNAGMLRATKVPLH